MIESLAKGLKKLDVSRTDKRELYRYLKFYRAYPQIVDTVSPQLYLPAGQLFTLLSFTHLKLLIELDTIDKRAFYQSLCIQGNWSVMELSRQIYSLLYERSMLSVNKPSRISCWNWGMAFALKHVRSAS